MRELLKVLKEIWGEVAGAVKKIGEVGDALTAMVDHEEELIVEERLRANLQRVTEETRERTRAHIQGLVCVGCKELIREDRASSALRAATAMVRVESEIFRRRLPDLRRHYEDKWVVFKEGLVVSAHDDIETAYAAGIKRFGLYGGQVVAHVGEPMEVWSANG